jgi:thiol-disulfide isomerase/thioredoxin
MIDLGKTMSYDEYMKGYTAEQAAKQKEKYEQAMLSEAAVKKIEALKDKTKIIIFSEGFCPDCHVVIPFVTKAAETNDKIELHFMNRTGNEQLLADMTGEARIPTIMFFTEKMQPKGVYVEFPETLKEKMSGKSIEEIKSIVNEYRLGKYNELIETQIVEILAK